MLCKVCKGKGGWIEPELETGQGPYQQCYNCKGTGKISALVIIKVWCWEHAPVSWIEWYGKRKYNDSY